MNKISICGVAVISNLTVCDGDGVSLTFLTVMRCSLTFFAVLRCSPPPHVLLILGILAANTIDKSRGHDKFSFAKCNKPHLKISFENLYFLDWVSQGFYYTHKQSLARVPLLGYREIIHTYPVS